jgi:hypothetical protein
MKVIGGGRGNSVLETEILYFSVATVILTRKELI